MNRRAFTLVEMMIVVAVVSALAAVVVPRYAALRDGQESRDLTSALMRVGADARLLAIESGQMVQVTYDDQRRTVVFETVDPETFAGTERKAIAVPEPIELTAFTLDGQTVGASDWLVQFYPDGSGSDIGIEVVDELYTYHVLIEGRDGSAIKADGQLPETAVQEWQAGELEQRV